MGRRLYAGVDIAAPAELVWRALTDYEHLDTFIPGLAENRCLARHQAGARLLQVGQEDLPFGIKFRARVILDIQEYPRGVPAKLCIGKGNGRGAFGWGVRDEGIFPEPRSTISAAPQDIAFSFVEGDFQAFRGIWRIQEGSVGRRSARLSYALHVTPLPWLPVRLIQGRIEGEVQVNLAAVRSHSEGLWAAQQAECGPLA